MATDMFLKLDGVDGEATDERHEKWIEVLSYSWGLSQTPSPGASSGARAGKVSVQDFSFVKRVDRASPTLMKAGCEGQHFKNATLAISPSFIKGEISDQIAAAVTNGKPSNDYLTYKLSDVLISTVRPGADSSTDDRALELVSFNFNKIEVSYLAPNGDQITGVANFQKI